MSTLPLPSCPLRVLRSLRVFAFLIVPTPCRKPGFTGARRARGERKRGRHGAVQAGGFRARLTRESAMLLKRIEAIARERGFATLVLGVNKMNTQAIAAYRKHGFAIRESVVTDIGGGFMMDDYVMVKLLSRSLGPFAVRHLTLPKSLPTLHRSPGAGRGSCRAARGFHTNKVERFL